MRGVCGGGDGGGDGRRLRVRVRLGGAGGGVVGCGHRCRGAGVTKNLLNLKSATYYCINTFGIYLSRLRLFNRRRTQQ